MGRKQVRRHRVGRSARRVCTWVVASVLAASAVGVVATAPPVAAAGTASITGSILDGEGNPIALGLRGAVLCPGSSIPIPLPPSGCPFSFANPYELGGLDAGTYTVVGFATTGSAIGHAGTPQTLTLGDGEHVTIPFTFGSRIQGQVTDPEGDAVVGATVRLESGGPIVNGGQVAVTDATGHYVTPYLGTGTVTVRVTGPFGSNLVAQESVAVDASETAVLDLQLGAGATISGTVTQAGTGAVPSAYVVISQEGASVASVTVDADGSYLVDGLPPGSYHVYFDASWHVGEWFDGAATVGAATAVVLAAGDVATGIDGTLDPIGPVVVGTVTDEVTGDPVGGACVTAWASDLGASSPGASDGAWCSGIRTSGAGTYAIGGLEGLTPPPVKVRVGDPSMRYVAEWYDDVATWDDATVITPGDDPTTVDVALARGGTVSGVVTDETTGAPVASVTVTVHPAESPSEPAVATAITGPDGAYTAGPLPTGDYLVQVIPPSYTEYVGEWYDDVAQAESATAVPVTVGADHGGVDFALARPPRIRGAVTDSASGLPVAGASVYVSSPAAPDNVVNATWTREDGTYDVVVPAGSYLLRVEDEQNRYVGEWYQDQPDPQSAAIVTLTDADVVADFVVTEGGSISGTLVHDGTGDPIVGEWIAVAVLDAATGSVLSGSAGYAYADFSTGAFVTRALPPGSYVLRAPGFGANGVAPEYYEDATTLAAAMPITITDASDVTGIVMSLGGTTVSGAVTDAETGEPVPDAWVYVYDHETFGYVAHGPVDNADGTYSFVLAPGSYVVSVSAPGGYVSQYYDGADTFDLATPVAVALDPVTGIDFVLGGATLSGTVTDADTGAPLAGICVSAAPMTGGGSSSYCTSTDGAYVLRMSPGSHAIWANTSGTAYVTTHLDNGGSGYAVAAGDAIVVDIALVRGARVSGTVTDAATGAPLANVCAGVYGDQGFAQGCSNTDGHYVTDAVPSGSYRVQFSNWSGRYVTEWHDDVFEETAATPVELTAGEDLDGLDAAMTLGAQLSGVVTNAADGAPVPGACVEVVTLGGEQVVATGCAGPNGTYLVNGVRPGEWLVRFSAHGYTTSYHDGAPTPEEATPVTFASGDALPLDAVLTPAVGGIAGTVQDGAGDPVEGACADLFDGPDGIHLVSAGCTGADGTFTTTGLVPGEYWVAVTDPSERYLTAWEPVTVVGGVETPLTVTLTPVGTGLLRVATDPPVPAVISVDGDPRDMWGLTWLPIAEGPHEVCFGEVTGFVAPPCEPVDVSPDATTEVVGDYTPVAVLRVVTEPALPSTVSIDGHPANDWGAWTAVTAGVHEVCFGKVEGWAPPPCEQVDVTAGETEIVTGQFTADAEATGPDEPFGFLRVTTSPAVPGRISIDGFPADTWGLNWVKVSPGEHEVCFSDDVVGFRAPACETVNVPEGGTGELVGTYVPWGVLRVATDPALPAVVFVDGVAANAWGVWRIARSGSHEVCFGPVAGYVAPDCEDVTVDDGATTTVVGAYAPLE